MTEAFVTLELYQTAQTRIAVLEAVLNEAAKQLDKYNPYGNHPMASKIRAIVKGEKE